MECAIKLIYQPTFLQVICIGRQLDIGSGIQNTVQNWMTPRIVNVIHNIYTSIFDMLAFI